MKYQADETVSLQQRAQTAAFWIQMARFKKDEYKG
jgi:hypothetical protein